MKSERVIYAGANPQSQDQDQGSDAMKAEILKKTKEDKYIKEERKRKRFMDNNDGNPSHGGEPAMDAGDWRSQLQADSRQRIINKIMETLLNHIPFSGQEGMTEIKKIAARFEEKMYGAAKSQSDYLRKISLKILTWESKYKSTNTNSLQLNSAGSSGMQPQVTIQGQQFLENIQSNISSAEVQNAISNLTESMVQQAAIPQEQILSTHQQQGQLPSPHMPSMEHLQTQFAQVQSPMNQMNPQQQHLGSQTASLDSTAPTEHTNGAYWEEEVCQKVSMDTNNWRSQLQADSRQRIVNKIMDTLKRHLPFSGQEELHELKKIAVRFEEKIYTAATSQLDYLRKLTLKMLTMESKSQNTMGNSSLPSCSGGNSNSP